MIGVYKIENQQDGKCFIGASLDIARTIKEQAFNNIKLKRAIDDIGIQHFKSWVLEEVKSAADLPKAQKFWIDFHASANKEFGYNRALKEKKAVANV